MMYHESMTSTKADLDKVNDVVYAALTKFYQKVIAPQMATKDDVEAAVAGLEERLTKRIDRIGELITDTRTNHERRISRLEDEIGVNQVDRLTV